MRWLAALSLFMTVAAPLASAASANEPAGHRFPVFFAPMKAKLGYGGTHVVSSAAKFAEEYKDKPITLVAYSSPPGQHYVEPADIDAERAQAVVAHLIADGVNKNRIHVIARGPVQPAVPMSHVEVRRVDIIVGTASAAK